MKNDRLQKFEWGTIEWIYESGKNPYTAMDIGIISINPGERQNKHVHYSDEQLIYVISGSGRQIINNEVSDLKQGMVFHMNPGDMHETINTGSDKLVELLISIPVNFDDKQIINRKKPVNLKFQLPEDFSLMMIKDVISDFYDSLLKPFNLPIAVFDMDGDIVVKSESIPEFCRKACKMDENIFNCELYNIEDEYKPPHFFEHTSFVCRYGITVFYLPIAYGDNIVGFIRGGHVREANRIIEEKTLFELPYERSVSSMNSLLRLMLKFQRSIQDYLSLIETDRQFIVKDALIKEQVEKKMILEHTLKKTESKILNIQINNHFLFNTLSAIAGIAIDDGSEKTYEAIIRLSKMFRYSMNEGQKGVALYEEIKHVEDYLNLQKIRFDNRFDYTIPEKCEKLLFEVPFNFLQPIVENSFKHGFKNKTEKMRVDISCEYRDGFLVLNIEDNGCGMSQERKKEIMENLIKGQGRFSGLAMIMTKMERIYGENVKFEIESEEGVGTKIKISIPEV